PVFDGKELVALLYLDGLDPRRCSAQDLDRLGKLTQIIARALSSRDAAGSFPHAGWEEYLESTPVEQIERERLVLLLNRNEWNIARVAGLLGVTRRTVYLRLRRLKVTRERVPKGPPRRAPDAQA